MMFMVHTLNTKISFKTRIVIQFSLTNAENTFKSNINDFLS